MGRIPLEVVNVVRRTGIDRRKLLRGCLALGAGALCAAPLARPRNSASDRRPQISRVAILKVEAYSNQIDRVLMDGLNLFNLDVRGKSILLKPNLVEYVPGREVNTHPLLVGAAAECLLRLGARSVVVGEGPGHQRDTELLLSESGLEDQLKHRHVAFVDLNRDELIKIPLRSTYTGLTHLWLPRSALEADAVVSMPKVKTHHWAGVTLSLKNMFGIVPGLKYGWPKNLLHWKGIHESVLDICTAVPIHLVIADGVQAMEGNGPLHGEARKLGVIVIGDDPVAADATMTRLMGLKPEKVRYIHQAGSFLGNIEPRRICQLGESPEALARPFESFQIFLTY
jgi:uncharacterized protein (DUF362 family)